VGRGDRELIREGLRSTRTSLRAAFLVSASALVLGALFVVSWCIFMPVFALLVSPATLGLALLLGTSPSVAFNSLAALVLSGGLAAATVSATFRILLRRARSRAQFPRRMTSSVTPGSAGWGG